MADGDGQDLGEHKYARAGEQRKKTVISNEMGPRQGGGGGGGVGGGGGEGS